MARQTHTVVQSLGSFPNPQALAAATQMTPVAADATNKENVRLTGKELVIIRNSGATGRAITFSSMADDKGRSGDLTDTLAAGKIGVYGPFTVKGWQQGDGYLNFECAHAECLITVVRLP